MGQVRAPPCERPCEELGYRGPEPRLPAPRARLAGNTASIRLLEKCGFEHEGPVVYDGDEYVLLVLRRR
jgi:hypothetical protein